MGMRGGPPPQRISSSSVNRPKADKPPRSIGGLDGPLAEMEGVMKIWIATLAGAALLVGSTTSIAGGVHDVGVSRAPAHVSWGRSSGGYRHAATYSGGSSGQGWAGQGSQGRGWRGQTGRGQGWSGQGQGWRDQGSRGQGWQGRGEQDQGWRGTDQGGQRTAWRGQDQGYRDRGYGYGDQGYRDQGYRDQRYDRNRAYAGGYDRNQGYGYDHGGGYGYGGYADDYALEAGVAVGEDVVAAASGGYGYDSAYDQGGYYPPAYVQDQGGYGYGPGPQYVQPGPCTCGG